MLDYPEISEIVDGAARTTLGKRNVVRVITEPSIDSEGQDSLRVMIIIAPGAVDRIKDDALVDNLVEIGNRLSRAHEDRTPIVEYATEEELAAGDDTEC